MGAIAFDLVGGLIAFQLHGTRRRYARSSLRSRLMFALVHVQPFVLPMFGQGTWRRAAARYSAAVLATAALECCTPHSASKRVLANGIATVASAADFVSDKSQQRWLGPVYLMKVIGGHGGITRQ